MSTKRTKRPELPREAKVIIKVPVYVILEGNGYSQRELVDVYNHFRVRFETEAAKLLNNKHSMVEVFKDQLFALEWIVGIEDIRKRII
jgi:hypothetical protein